ncbi:hypothetical protein Taro_025458, partial [Colocasia esculenta]|nr:hypothetical protein [Colocasia esculenta]
LFWPNPQTAPPSLPPFLATPSSDPSRQPRLRGASAQTPLPPEVASPAPRPCPCTRQHPTRAAIRASLSASRSPAPTPPLPQPALPARVASRATPATSHFSHCRLRRAQPWLVHIAPAPRRVAYQRGPPPQPPVTPPGSPFESHDDRRLPARLLTREATPHRHFIGAAGHWASKSCASTTDCKVYLFHCSGLEIGGEMNLTAGIQVAQLALKHRQNKKQQQRIIVFAGSPIKHDKKTLEAIGKKLKKNSVALDIVDFGEEEDGKPEKLEALLAAVNNNGSSHIVHVPPGSSALSDVLISTPIFTGDGGSGFAAAAAAAAGGVSSYDFGVDPNLDPELALALRLSMEEERARQEAAAKKAAEDSTKVEKAGEQASSSRDIPISEATSSSSALPIEKKDDLMLSSTAGGSAKAQWEIHGYIWYALEAWSSSIRCSTWYNWKIFINTLNSSFKVFMANWWTMQVVRLSGRAASAFSPDSCHFKMTITFLCMNWSQDDDSALLQQALAMSVDKPESGQSSGMADTDMSDAVDQDLALALKMSVQDNAKDLSSQTEMNKVLGDQSFMSSILASLPGVDPNDPSVKDLLASLQGKAEVLYT